ncbi:MAG: hypothetical protein JWN14_1210 [Chthonomonadales bacterium]|nr:hypothetical protein [Chthonomonadales bacterium]
MSKVQTQIDSYLDRICRPLIRTLSAEEVAEQRAEMRTHLEALFAAYLEAGSSEADAIRLSLEQFGKERRLQNDWRGECETTQLSSEKAAFWPAFRFAARAYAFAGLLAGLVGTGFNFSPNPLSGWWENFSSLMSPWINSAFIVILCFYPVAPVLAGICVGCEIRHRPMLLSVLAALSTYWIIPSLYTFSEILCRRPPTFVSHGYLAGFEYSTSFAVLFVCWGLLGTVLGRACARFRRHRVTSNC